MTDDEKAQAEAASWREWQTAWGNTESGAHAHGWEHGYQAGAAENARLRAALALHIYQDGHTVACSENDEPSDRCVATCQQTRAALRETPK